MAVPQGTLYEREYRQEIVKMLLNNPQEFNRWRERSAIEEVDLRGVDLFGAELEGVNFHGADLSYATLRGANLAKANLENAQLKGADLRGITYDGVKLRGSNIWNAQVSENFFHYYVKQLWKGLVH